MKKTTLFCLLLVLFAVIFTFPTFALSMSESPAVANYRPDTATLTPTFYSTYAKTTITFKYSSDDIMAINTIYANNRYVGVDIKNQNSGTGIDMMECYSISTTLPNAYTDLEDNSGWFGSAFLSSDGRNDEAEIVALLPPGSNTNYTMTVNWTDHRSGNEADAGSWAVNAEQSSYNGITGEYNVYNGNYLGMGGQPYSKYKGQA